ncbi:MAG: glycoside hydrolase family 32 protein [Bacteroidota bacterium]|nr:glycoside hydrolase family 32 protein [Bacteroidota bacterium]MDP4211395.1 glycoside hydrolase family 32 protein [Bacteroidota bacterium]MDP4248622.1 glycoside hydrolase family 32 protein [Bacteroidota bacterium]
MKKRFMFCLIAFLFSSLAFSQSLPTPQWRPVYHFTPEKNWTNDPNGLVYLNGVYHLFNQQNPYDNAWGHMSWGHATSTDLIHWKHLPIAIPEVIDRDTTWIFSGCNVWDKNNTSGFCKHGGCLVAVYTADQPNLKKESQFIAYSNDGGTTYTNYEHNPVIDLHQKDFRDPNVFWYAPASQWIMIVSMPSENKVRFYGSPDLKNWNFLSDFGPQGLAPAVWECPFLIQLPVEGNPTREKWVIMNSVGGTRRGAFMQYFVGEFNGREFSNDNPADLILPVDYGDCVYAAIPWNNLPGPDKTYIGWMVPNPQETYPWRGQMSIPRDLSLKETKEGLRLLQKPAALIRNNLPGLSHHRVIEIKNLEINNQETNIDKQHKIPANAYWLTAEFVVKSGTAAGFKIAQENNRYNQVTAETVIGYDKVNHRLYVDRTRSGNAKGMNQDRLLQTIDLPDARDRIRLDILLDKSSLEVFVNDGEKVLTTYIFPGADANAISAFSAGGNAIFKSVKIWDLSTP